MYFICFKITPSPSFPPTVYLLQPGLTHVVHGKLPGFMPIQAMYKIQIKVHSSQFSGKIIKVGISNEFHTYIHV